MVEEKIITLADALDTPTFYGVNNQNILCLKNQHPDVRVIARGYQVKVIGSESAIELFENDLHTCEQFCIRNSRLAEQDILMLKVVNSKAVYIPGMYGHRFMTLQLKLGIQQMQQVIEMK